MKNNRKKTTRTLGGFIADIYSARGCQRAARIVRFAVNEHFVVFSGQQRFVIS
jgi:hypothetical protein